MTPGSMVTIESVCLVFLLVILSANIILPRTGRLKRDWFFYCLVLTFAGCVFDMASWASELVPTPLPLQFTFNFLALTMTSFIVSAFAFYITDLIREKKPISNIYAYAITAVNMIGVIAAIGAAACGHLFTITPDEFVPGIRIFADGGFSYTLSMALAILSLAFLFCLILHNTEVLGKRKIAVFSIYFLLPLSAGILELFRDDILLVYAAVSVSITIIYVMLQSTHINELQVRDELLSEISYVDQLTGLLNRRAFERDINLPGEQDTVGIVFCDMNGLKKINDEEGHKAGDAYLKRFAGIITEHFPHDAVYRISGDEFIAAVRNMAAEEFERRAAALRQAINENDDIAAVGTVSGFGDSISPLIQQAEIKMYDDKKEYYRRNPGNARGKIAYLQTGGSSRSGRKLPMMKNSFSDDLVIDQDTLPVISGICEHLPGGFFIYYADGDQELIYYNRQMLTLFGCKDDTEFRELTGNSFKGIVHPDDYALCEADIKHQIASGTDHIDHVIYRYIRKDGSVGVLDDYGYFSHSDSFGDIYYVFAQDITRKHQEEHERLENVNRVMSLEDKFETLYDVDLETGDYRVYVKGQTVMDDINTLLGEQREFFSDTLKNIELVIHPEDKQGFAAVVNKEYILKTLETKPSIDWYYRLVLEDKPTWFRLRILYKDESKRNLIIGVFNAEEEVAERERNEQIRNEQIDKMAGGISSYILYPETGRFLILRQQEYYDENYTSAEDYTTSTSRYVQQDVYAADRERAADELSLPSIVRHLENESEYIVRYRDASNGIPRWYEMRAVRLSESEILLGFSDIENEMVSNTVLKKLADDFTALYYVDLDTGNYVPYHLIRQVEDIRPYYARSPKFVDLAHGFAESALVRPEDREGLYDLYPSDEVVRARLRDRKKLSLLFKRNYGGEFLWTEAIIIKCEGEAEEAHSAVVGFVEKDQAIREREEHFRKAEEAARLMDTVAAKYSVACLLDLATGAFRPLKVDENIRDKFDAFDSYPGMKASLRKILHPSDMERMESELDPAVIREKLQNSLSYRTEYRTVIDHVTKWHEMIVTSVGNDEVVMGFTEKDEKITKKRLEAKKYDEYLALYVVDFDTEMIKAVKPSEILDVVDINGSLPYESAMKQFAAEYEGDVRDFLERISDLDYLQKTFETEDKLTYFYRSTKLGDDKWVYMTGYVILRHADGTPAMFTLGFSLADVLEAARQELNEQLQRQQKEAAVISALSKDFDCVNYIVLQNGEDSDIAIPFRTSSKFRAIIPGWDTESNFRKRLDLLIRYIGYEADIPAFRRQTRRDIILRHLMKEPAYYVNTRAVVEGTVQYFQLKFTADRDKNDRLIGVVVGIHNIDDEMRQEIETREKVERLVDEQTQELKLKNEELSKVNNRIIEMIGNIVENRDEESGDHIHRVKYLTRILAMQVMKDLPEYKLTAEDASAIADMSPLHDVGKIKIPDSILLKKGRLTEEEFEVMKTHSAKGCEIIEGMSEGWNPKYVQMSRDICLYHHEKWDGKGYPCGLKGDEIPIAAQIVSIADVYDALISERCYKPAYSREKAFRMILDGECGQYSEKLLSCFIKCRSDFENGNSYADDLVRADEKEELLSVTEGEFISDALPVLEKISESMPGGFFAYQADAEEKLIFFNSTMVDYLGCSSREEFIAYTGNSFKGIVHPEDYAQITDDIRHQITKNNLGHIVYRIIRKDGSIRWLDAYGKFIRSKDMRDVFFVFANDFTETYVYRDSSASMAKPRPRQDEKRMSGGLQGLKVMVVDDSDLTREIHRDLLEAEGASVVEAANGAEAVRLVRESTDYDLILMDLVMPVMSGVTASKEIIKLLNEAGVYIPIICLTSEGSDEQIREALDVDVFGYMYKPLNISELSGLVIGAIREKFSRVSRGGAGK